MLFASLLLSQIIARKAAHLTRPIFTLPNPPSFARVSSARMSKRKDRTEDPSKEEDLDDIPIGEIMKRRAAAKASKEALPHGTESEKGKNVEKTKKSVKAEAERVASDTTAKRPRKTVNYNEDIQIETNVTEVKIPKSGNIDVYTEASPRPTRSANGDLVFQDYPNFRPNLTPKEVLQMGSFGNNVMHTLHVLYNKYHTYCRTHTTGGAYFRPIKSRVTGIAYKDVWKELPPEWLTGLSVPTQVASSTYNKNINKYKADCGGDLDMWETSGWITDSDPYGWFQWYCRFYEGRRCSDDERQISRGNNVMGPTGRWRNSLVNKVVASNKTLPQALDDKNISPKIRQVLQHWGYQLTMKDLEAGKKKREKM